MSRRLAFLLLAPVLFSLAAATVSSAAPTAGPGLIAPRSECAGQDNLEAPDAAQEQAMLCMTNYARAQFGEGQLETSVELEESARDKSRDILQCDSFSHYACGREFTYWMRETGYIPSQCWRVGENLAWGTGAFGTVRSIFRAWMASTEHRENILGDYTQIGIDLATGTLAGSPATHVWTQHFGSHC